MANEPFSPLGEVVNTMTRRRINTDIEQRGYIWQCHVPDNLECFIANSDSKKQPCGRWIPYFGRKWASGKKDAKWQGICPNDHNGMGERKRQLNIGQFQAHKYFETRKETVEEAEKKNQEKDNSLAEIEAFYTNLERELLVEEKVDFKGEWF